MAWPSNQHDDSDEQQFWADVKQGIEKRLDSADPEPEIYTPPPVNPMPKIVELLGQMRNAITVRPRLKDIYRK